MTDDRSPAPAAGRAFWLALACVTIARLLLAWRLDPCDDEAYYFYWSLHPQLSYFDHPPLAAWAMTIAGALFGGSIWTVRAWPIIAGAAVALFGRALGRRMFDVQTGDRAGILLLLAPAFAGNGLLMTPDTLFGAAWAAALYCTWRALQPGTRSISLAWWALAGLAVGLGLLSKYNMILYFGGLTLLWVLSRGRRKEIFLGAVLAAAVALAVFSPVLIWNHRNDWISFRFQLGHGFGSGGEGGLNFATFGEYLGLLLVIVSPGLALLAFWTAGRGLLRGPVERRFLSCFFWAFVAFFALSSLKSRVQANWPMLAFFSGLLLVGAAWQEYPRWVRRAAVALLACMLVPAILGMAYLASPRSFVLRAGGAALGFPRMEEFVGGRDVADVVVRQKAESRLPMLCVTKHQLFGKLSFFAPELRPAMFMPPGRKPRFPWIRQTDLEGCDALIVSSNAKDLRGATAFFDAVEPLGITRLRAKEAREITLHFARGIGYRPEGKK